MEQLGMGVISARCPIGIDLVVNKINKIGEENKYVTYATLSARAVAELGEKLRRGQDANYTIY
jgi:hypothetical protein